MLGATVRVHGQTEARQKKSFQVGPGGQLVVQADRGSIDIKTSEGSGVEIEVIRKIRDLSKAQAEEVLQDHELSFNQEGNKVTVRARFKNASKGFWNNRQSKLQVQYQISIPRKFNVDAKTAGGTIRLADLAGEARLETSGGNLDLAKVEGTVWGKTSGGSIALASATETAELTTSGGNIQVGEVRGTTAARTSGGSVSVKSSHGKLTAKTSGGNITIDEALNDVDAQTSGGSIRIKKAKGRLLAKTSGGNIDLGEIQGAISANTSGGSITASLAGQPEEESRLETTGGNIKVGMKEKIGIELDARASGGGVHTDIPISVQGELKRGSVKGKVNGGGPALILQTSGGSIYVSKL